MNPHTGNWPGKTVANAQGRYRHQDTNFVPVDIPGTYSLMANSEEEEIARDFICFGGPDAVVVVADATCRERNLNLVLQTMEISKRVVLCVNLLDEAKKKKIQIDLKALSEKLGIPVVGTSARNGKGLDRLMDAVTDLTRGRSETSPMEITYGEEIERAISILEPALDDTLNGRLNSRWHVFSAPASMRSERMIEDGPDPAGGQVQDEFFREPGFPEERERFLKAPHVVPDVGVASQNDGRPVFFAGFQKPGGVFSPVDPGRARDKG